MNRSISPALLALAVTLGAFQTAFAEPSFVRVSFSHADTATRAAIAWNTDAVSDPSVVQYGTTTAYGDEASGIATDAGSELGTVHEVHLEGLTPDTVYHYRAGGPGDWTGDHTFRTGPEDGCEPFRFVALGDNRSNLDWGPSI